MVDWTGLDLFYIFIFFYFFLCTSIVYIAFYNIIKFLYNHGIYFLGTYFMIFDQRLTPFLV